MNSFAGQKGFKRYFKKIKSKHPLDLLYRLDLKWKTLSHTTNYWFCWSIFNPHNNQVVFIQSWWVGILHFEQGTFHFHINLNINSFCACETKIKFLFIIADGWCKPQKVVLSQPRCFMKRLPFIMQEAFVKWIYYRWQRIKSTCMLPGTRILSEGSCNLISSQLNFLVSYTQQQLWLYHPNSQSYCCP